ncbi:MAG: DMT family transporter [Cyanothece sp. SIO1E1]|nr:DMT family transporter [Cyanothece sp. SIO1E1]
MSNNLELPRQPVGSIPTTLIGLFCLSLALIAVSFAAIFIRWSEQEIGPNATVFNRLWIATLVFGLWDGLKFMQSRQSENLSLKPLKYTQQDLLLLLIVGVVSSASVACWAWSLTQTTVANSTLLRNLTPLFTSLGGWLFLSQRFESKFIVGMGLAMVGAIAIGWDDLELATANFIGDGVALLSALFYGVNLLVVERLRAKWATPTILLWRCSIGALLLLPVVLLSETRLFPYSWQGWVVVICLAIVCQAFGQGLLVYSLKNFSSGFIAIFLLLEPVLTAGLAWLIFAENLSLLNGLAFSLVLAGIYLAKSSQSAQQTG